MPSADISVASFIVANPDVYGYFLHQMDIPFGEKLVQLTFGICSSLWKKHGAFPTQAELLEIIERHPQIAAKKTIQAAVIATAQQIYEPTNHSAVTKEVVLNRIIDNYKETLLEKVYGISPDSITQQSYDIAQQIDKLNSLLGSREDDWIFPLSDANLVDPMLVLEEMLGPPIPTGLSHWNRWLSGGFRQGESMMLIGITNQGKTAFLCSMQLDFVRTGFRVVSYALDSPKHEIFQRNYANLSGVGIEEERIASEFTQTLQRSVNPDWKQRLIYRHWPRHAKTMDDVKRDVGALKRKLKLMDLKAGVPAEDAGKIHVIGLDSIDCLMSRRKLNENWLAAASVAAEFDGFCKEENMFGICTCQAKISGVHMDVLGMKEATESWGKNHPFSHVAGWCRTPQEMANGTARIYLDKAKRVKCNYLVPVHFNKSLMRITERGEPYYLSASDQQASSGPAQVAYEKRKEIKVMNEPGEKIPKKKRIRTFQDDVAEGESVVSAPRRVTRDKE